MSNPSSSKRTLSPKRLQHHSQLSSEISSLPTNHSHEVIDLTSDNDDPPFTQQHKQPKRRRERRFKKVKQRPIEPVQKTESPQPRSQSRNQAITPTLSTFYNGFLERGEAEEYLEKFDSLCETYHKSEESMDIAELESLKARIHAFRTEYQKAMACCKKDEQVAWQQLCDTIFKQFSQTYYSTHYNMLIQKLNEFKDHLNNHLINRENHEWVDHRCNINDLLRQKHSIHSIEKRHNTRIYYLKQNIQQELKDKQQFYHDEQNKSLEESQQLYNYVKKRISIEIKKLVPHIGDDVVRALCQQVIEEHQMNEQRKMECITSDAITQLERQRHSKLQHIIKDQQENFHSIEETIKMMNKLKEAQIKVKEIEKECSGEKFETMNDIQIKVDFLEQKVHEVLQRTKRLREEEILVASERKKSRLEVVEKNLDQLQTKVNQAKQDVLLSSFPLRIKQSIHEIYGVLNNHGEFLRHIIDPIAADNDEVIDQKHLDKISILQDGLTFPLRYSIEKLANDAANRVFGNAEERLDVLEKKLD